MNFSKTYDELLGFSENILMRKSPSWLGSNVEGMMQYVPGGNLCRPQISRRLMNDGDLATEALYLKNLRSKGPALESFSWNQGDSLWKLVEVNNQRAQQVKIGKLTKADSL